MTSRNWKCLVPGEICGLRRTERWPVRCLVAKSCLILCTSLDCSTLGSPVLHYLPRVCSNLCPLSWCCYLTISSSAALFSFCLQYFPCISMFSSRLAFHSRWPKYWNFSFSISPSNGYSGLISFRIHWFDLLASKGFLSLLRHHSSKASILCCSAFFVVQLSLPYLTTEKVQSSYYIWSSLSNWNTRGGLKCNVLDFNTVYLKTHSAG